MTLCICFVAQFRGTCDARHRTERRGAPYLQTTVLGVRQMSSTEALNAKHVRVSGILSIIGLVLVGLSLVWDSPISTGILFHLCHHLCRSRVRADGSWAFPLLIHYPFSSASAHVSSADHDLHFLRDATARRHPGVWCAKIPFGGF